MRDIRAFARRIAEEFKPRRIILFGSHAYGRPNEDSDVDLLVVMPYQGYSADKSVEIRTRIDFPHPLDLLVRSPREVKRRLAINDWFMHDVIEKGRVLYDADDARVGCKGGGGLRQRRARVPGARRSEL